MVHGDCYVTIIVYLHRTQAFPSTWTSACYVMITVDRGSTSTINIGPFLALTNLFWTLGNVCPGFETIACMFLHDGPQILEFTAAVADLHSKILDARPPQGPKFFQFHAVFGNFWQNRMLAPPPGSWRPLLGEILDKPLWSKTFRYNLKKYISVSRFNVLGLKDFVLQNTTTKTTKNQQQKISQIRILHRSVSFRSGNVWRNKVKV